MFCCVVVLFVVIRFCQFPCFVVLCCSVCLLLFVSVGIHVLLCRVVYQYGLEFVVTGFACVIGSVSIFAGMTSSVIMFALLCLRCYFTICCRLVLGVVTMFSARFLCFLCPDVCRFVLLCYDVRNGTCKIYSVKVVEILVRCQPEASMYYGTC